MTDKPVSDYLKKPLRDLCRCGRGPVKAETEMCQHCEDDAQANVVDLETERWFREYEKAMEGKR